MDRIRIHLGPMPQMLRTIVGDLLAKEPDIVIVGNSKEHTDCLLEARRSNALIVLALDSVRDGSTCLELILAGPPLGLLAVSPDGHSAAGVSLSRRPITLGTGDPSVLADSIREMAAELSAGSSACTGSQGTSGSQGHAGPAPQNPLASGGD